MNVGFAHKFERLLLRIRDRQWLRYGATLFAGKTLGVALLLISIAVLPTVIGMVGQLLSGSPAYADAMPTSQPAAASAMVSVADLTDPGRNPVINPINTLWTLLGAFLVFGMQVGFTMLEAGFCRSRETVNVLVECVFDTCLCGVLYYAWGYAFMFGAGNGFIGLRPEAASVRLHPIL